MSEINMRSLAKQDAVIEIAIVVLKFKNTSLKFRIETRNILQKLKKLLRYKFILRR